MWILLLVLTTLLYFCTNRRYRWLYMVYKTLPRDIKITWIYFKIFNIAKIAHRDKKSLDQEFSTVAKKNLSRTAFYFENEKWSFAQVQELSHKITKYFISEGYVKGDTVALLMENCPEYPCVFLGLSRIGVITALINSNLIKDPLLHCITVVKPKGIIVGGSCSKALQDILPDLSNAKIYQLNRFKEQTEMLPDSVNLEKELRDVSGSVVEYKLYTPHPFDPLIYIYTSGTTGLPKASVLTQLRFLLGTGAFALVTNLTPEDVIYTPMPLYHTTGTIFGLAQALVTGASVVIKKKFSATNYFTDCIKYNVTVAQYIGEMCRYILASSAQSNIGKHKIRVMAGNGLKPQIWQTFVKKFNIKNIVEMYGATESVSNFVNMDNKVGAVGYIPWFLKPIYSVTLLKCDEMGQLIKNADGHYIECDVGEPGVVVGKIDPEKAVLRFDGYTDSKASNRKILHDVFKKGDMYFNSGDILIYDEFRYFYFKDRTGDTFRWKAENVSTSEVEAVISNLLQLTDVVVYGVEIPNTEGRAGMAAVMDPNDIVDMESLGNQLKSNLPSYAIPVFIRLLDAIPLTSTFKLSKVVLKNEGYDLSKSNDKIYFFDSKMGKYVRFNESLYEGVKNNTLRL